MPGLDESDVIAFWQLIEVPTDEIDVLKAQFIGEAEAKVATWNALIANAPPEKRLEVSLFHERSIKRRQDLLLRLRSSDPWAFWPVLPDEHLYRSAAWASQGYWQGYLADVHSRTSLAKRQWEGAGIAASITEFNLPELREKLAIWAMAHWWRQVDHKLINLPPPFMDEVDAILQDEWWDLNLAPIAWGGGIGKAEGDRLDSA